MTARSLQTHNAFATSAPGRWVAFFALVTGQHGSDWSLGSDSRWHLVALFLQDNMSVVCNRGRLRHVYGSHVWRDLKSSGQTDLVKWTDGTFPQSGFWLFIPLLCMVWPLSKEYTTHHPDFIAQLRVAIKDFRVNLVSLNTSKHVIEISSLSTCNHRQNIVCFLPLNPMITQACPLLKTWAYRMHRVWATFIMQEIGKLLTSLSVVQRGLVLLWPHLVKLRHYPMMRSHRKEDLPSIIRSSTVCCELFVCIKFWQVFVGEPCNSNGGPLDPESPPPVAKPKDVTDWTLYGSRVAFKLADFIYRCNQMSASNFNMLCKL